MKPKKIILVTGATGAQGGSVAKALLQSKKFDVRILTRDASSPKAIALQQAGAEIVAGDFNDIDSLHQALKDVYGVFGVTNYWEHFGKEIELGRNLIDAVRNSGVRHFVFSSLDNYHKLSNGSFSVPQYDIKAILKEYAKSFKLPSTFVQMSFYFENFFSIFPLRNDKYGNLHFGFPLGDSKLAMASVEDMGGVVATIFDHPVEYTGRTVGIVAENRPCSEYAYIMSKVLQRNVYYTPVAHDVYAAYNSPVAAEQADTFQVQRLYAPNRQMDLIESYGLNPGMLTLEKWMIKNKEKFNRLINAQQVTSNA